jgi:hypothetical protein
VIALAAAFEDLLAVLDRMEIPFFIGGSIASGTHGLARQTNDIDVVADVAPERVVEICEALSPAFYVDAGAIEVALRTGRSFNAIHLKGAYKFDFFPVGDDRFARSELARRRYTTTTITGLENIQFPVASTEDTILAKLAWFRKGGEVSDRQWHDILGVIRVQAGRLDVEYLRSWAVELGVADLLSRALAGRPED